MNNTVSDLCHEIKSEYCVKNKITFLSSKTFLFFFKHKYIPFSWKGIFLGFLRIQLPRHFFAEADTTKHRYASTKALAFAHCQGKF